MFYFIIIIIIVGTAMHVACSTETEVIFNINSLTEIYMKICTFTFQHKMVRSIAYPKTPFLTKP